MSDEMATGRRLDPADHHDDAWHIHDVAPDFQLIDAWSVPVAGAYEEFPDFVELFLSLDLADDEESRLTGVLFAARLKIGELLGSEDEVLSQPIPGCEETSLRDRLSPELRASADLSDASDGEAIQMAQLVYQTDNESAIELSNSTVHAVIHLVWVAAEETGANRYRGQMGIYVKTRGRLGQLYMPAIAPFRHYIVYPALMRRLGRVWQERNSGTTAT